MRISPNAMRKPTWRSLALGTVSSLALAAVAQPALAQDAGQDEEETEGDAPKAVAGDENIIVVSGFKAALSDAQNVKQNADTFVDAISSEDIGALPDRSVTEALQRVPGVNIGRFEKTSDPDRFSVEGTGVIIRGLPFVRSELNGRDIFSANGGIALSFSDISPEQLSRVEVFKNVTADMIEGSIAGTVNLVTRRPLDNPGFHLSGSIEANYGDLREEWSPSFSILGSTTYEGDAGSLGFQLGYTNSELRSRTDASQVTDPCYRDAGLTTGCIRTNAVGSGGIGAPTGVGSGSFPPANSVVVPKGAGVRTTDLDRDREAWSAVAQFESPDRSFLMTFEWLRSETTFFTDEFALLALVNDDALFPVERADGSGAWQFDGNGVFQSGILTQNQGNAYATPFGLGGLPLESLRFQRDTKSITEDFSFDIDWNVTDRLRVNFEAQRVESSLRRDSVIGAMNTWADLSLDLTGSTPQVEFLTPQGAPSDYFSSGFYTYYWFLLDSAESNDGDMDTLRFDAEYDISDTGFFRSARVGARWAERERTNRNTNFSTWGNLSAPWAGRAGCAPWNAGPNCPFQPGRFFTGLPGQEFAIAGGAYVDEFPNASIFTSPFGNNFQRGNTPTPIPGGGAFFFGSDNLLDEYLAGESRRTAIEINRFSQTPNPFFGIQGRSFLDSVTGVSTPCDPYCPPEISSIVEETKAAYARVDFGHDFSNGWVLEGNIGLRYVETEIPAGGLIGFPNGFFFDNGPGGNGDGVVSVAEINASCAIAPPGQPLPGYCSLSPARLQEFASAFTGEILDDTRTTSYDNWLPAFNAKLDVGSGLLFRFAVSKGISRPDLSLFAAGGLIGDNTGVLRDSGTLATGPLFVLNTGNPDLRPITSWNYDVSAEWYFDDVGSLTISAFLKDIDGIVETGLPRVTYTAPSGATAEVEVRRPENVSNGTLKGVEIGYQQTYDFLPAPLDGLGFQGTYTYVDGGDFGNSDLDGNQSVFASLQPLAGISKHTVNATVFYEKGPFAARAAYNWRSDFLITPRDDIFPFSPIWQESGGQLDASIFYALTDQIKLGVQGVNLLDTVTETSQVIDFDGNRITRSAFRNDRRFTFLARFNF